MKTPWISDALFPPHLRRGPKSLKKLARDEFIRYLIRIIFDDVLFRKCCIRLRRHIHDQLLPQFQTELIQNLIPTENPWKFPCLKSKRRVRCTIHRECQLVFMQWVELSITSKSFKLPMSAHFSCGRIVKLLLTSNVTKLAIDFRRIKLREFEYAFIQLQKFFKNVQCNNLTSLKLFGGSAQTDIYLSHVEIICRKLVTNAPNLQTLHIPVCNNESIKSIAKFPALRTLVIDRTKYL